MAFSPGVERWRGSVAARWPAGEVDNALAVMQCESGGDPNAANRVGEISLGLMQINVGPGAHPELASLNLFDGQTNLDAAYRIWQASGWKPWSCASMIPGTGASPSGTSYSYGGAVVKEQAGIGSVLLFGAALYVIWRLAGG